MARKMTEWPSKRGPITKIMPSDGCIGDTVPLAVGKWYDFHEFGWYMGDVGVIYLRPCETRYGDFPYCEEMRHDVFSITKSLGALVSMLHLAEKYGDDVFDLKIKKYLPVTADHDGWDDVTFADALNMATGIGEASPDREGAEYVRTAVTN